MSARALCGHEVAAVGEPGSIARMAVEFTLCEKCATMSAISSTDSECDRLRAELAKVTAERDWILRMAFKGQSSSCWFIDDLVGIGETPLAALRDAMARERKDRER